MLSQAVINTNSIGGFDDLQPNYAFSPQKQQVPQNRTQLSRHITPVKRTPGVTQGLRAVGGFGVAGTTGANVIQGNSVFTTGNNNINQHQGVTRNPIHFNTEKKDSHNTIRLPENTNNNNTEQSDDMEISFTSPSKRFTSPPYDVANLLQIHNQNSHPKNQIPETLLKGTIWEMPDKSVDSDSRPKEWGDCDGFAAMLSSDPSRHGQEHNDEGQQQITKEKRIGNLNKLNQITQEFKPVLKTGGVFQNHRNTLSGHNSNFRIKKHLTYNDGSNKPAISIVQPINLSVHQQNTKEGWHQNRRSNSRIGRMPPGMINYC